ncbi:MAG: LIC_10190 family membrane protein, partial [Bellilinea sp.]
MIAAAILIALILLTSWFYGRAAIHGLGRLFNVDGEKDIRPSIVILIGFGTLIFIGQLFSLVMPLGLVAILIVAAGGIAIAWVLNRSGSLNIASILRLLVLGWPLLALVGLAVLENSTHVPANPDTGIYHAQAIHWLEAYPVVPGLGNLHTRLAFNSSWLALNALFSFSFLGLRSFHLVSAALTLTAGIDFAGGAIDWYRGQGTFANNLRTIFLPLVFFVLGSQLSSPGTDLPVILFLWIVLPAWLDALPEVKGSNSLREIILFTIVVTLVTIKLSAAPVLLLAAWIGLKNLKNPGTVLKLAGIAGVILLPWIVRNIILSGYLIYPLPGIDGFNLDWKIPPEIARTEVLTIQAWARDPGAAVEEVLAKPFFSWLPLWLIEKTANQKLIVLGAAVSPVIFALGLASGHQAK